MTPRELLMNVPHPKHCMADGFDSKPGLQCDGGRDASFHAWFAIDGLLKDPDVKVWVCETHDRYRNNGGTQLGPLVLRAAAEAFKRQIADATEDKNIRKVTKRRRK